MAYVLELKSNKGVLPMRACIECMTTTKEAECCGMMTLTKGQLKKHLETCKKSSDWKTTATVERLLKQMDV